MRNKFSSLLQSYLSEYLVKQKNYSINTMISYSNTFRLLIEFLEEFHDIKPNKISFDNLSDIIIIEFLDWCEQSRNSSIATRNQRLSAIKSFFKYVQRKEPSLMDSCSKIINLENKKSSTRIISYFTEEEIKLLISYVNANLDFKSLLLVSMLYDLGVRVSELINIHVCDLNLQSALPSVIIRNGKGNKTRIIPINDELKKIIEVYLDKAYVDYGSGHLLYTKFKNPYTRFGIYDFVNRLITKLKQKYPQLFMENYHPHSFRHSKATHLYNNGVMLLTIKDFLGHSSITATEIYATPDSKHIREQIEKGNIELNITNNFSDNQKSDLLEWLRYYVKK